jgi:hypothetical protein
MVKVLSLVVGVFFFWYKEFRSLTLAFEENSWKDNSPCVVFLLIPRQILIIVKRQWKFCIYNIVIQKIIDGFPTIIK